jgi:hypothetical protein
MEKLESIAKTLTENEPRSAIQAEINLMKERGLELQG